MESNLENEIRLNDYIFKAFAFWFRTIKCGGAYSSWTDDQIDLSMNKDDIKEFIEYIENDFK